MGEGQDEGGPIEIKQERHQSKKKLNPCRTTSLEQAAQPSILRLQVPQANGDVRLYSRLHMP